MAVLTNTGADLWSTAMQTNGAQTAVTYVSVGTGVGTLGAALTNGSNYTALTLAGSGASIALSAGQQLTLIDGLGDTQVVTVASPGASIGATSIPVTSFTANANFAIGAGVATTPTANDTALNSGEVRIAATPGSAGAAAGESLNTAYFDPTTATGLYLEVGYWGGSTATATPGTGTLIARDVQWWNHTQGADSALPELDITL